MDGKQVGLLKGGSSLQLTGNKFFNPSLEDASFQEDAVMAFKAFYSYASPQPHHLPFIAATGMLFLEANDVPHLNFHKQSLYPGHKQRSSDNLFPDFFFR